MFWKILKNSLKNIFAGVSFLTKLQAVNLKSSEAATGDSLENKAFLKFLQISLKKNMCWSLFLKSWSSEGLQHYQKRLQHRWFPVKFTNFLRTINLNNICERLLLKII